VNFKLAAMMTLVASLPVCADSIERRASVCVEYMPELQVAGMEKVAGDIFGKIGVRIEWKRAATCSSKDIRVHWSMRTKATDHPGAMAYAMPYEGTTIVIFVDRVGHADEPRRQQVILGHVLAHEIGHILQGESRHSVSGIMKPNFSRDDIRDMCFRNLAFEPEDARLIYFGMKARAARLAILASNEDGQLR
jgi:hypothetical protein